MLFEYFTFALFVENLQAIGFEINDIGDDYPVPYFIRMNRVTEMMQK
jgi:methanogenic corrinoid protein MtbC1